MEKIKVGIIGATGYAGAELVRLLASHPVAEVVAVSSVSYEGQKFSDVYPHFIGINDTVLQSADEVIEKSEVIFASLPHGLSEPLAEQCIAKGKLLIDLGADFRMYSAEAYAKWYKREYSHPELHKLAVYSLPELYRDKTVGAKIIGNPGCYPTSISLGCAPALRHGLVETDGVIIDSKSGVTGAGRGLSQTTHYPDNNEAFSAYKAGEHRHTPEIEQVLSDIAGQDMTVTFVPHLLPVNRGIESTVYLKLKDGVTEDEVRCAYEKAYSKEKFVRVLPKGSYANIKNVRCTNYCDISLHFDMRARRLIVCAVIDNMVKGAAGQAIQNMNLYFGLPEDTGLCMVAPAF
ncbi:MAG: N-acetyl-gamma-glutamyl-phosphate reductase [Clostridia bacterium]|nr:N-acetyl-gamma-glutamyl-phosphate reductase [Clostridia bacterium]